MTSSIGKYIIDKAAIEVVGEAIFSTLTPEERRVINWLAENETINVSQVQRLTQRSWPSAKNLLLDLKRKGILVHKRKKGKDRDPEAHFVLSSVKRPSE
jgi:predicted transcriptional regulator